MNKKILILGGYGTFGRRITGALTKMPYVECMMGGRNPERAKRVARQTGARSIKVDTNDTDSLRHALDGVFAVINASGPYENGNFQVARQCARLGIHYIDLADSREYVRKFTQLDQQAKKSGCLLVTGASSVPAVSSALVDLLSEEFDKITAIHTAISPGNKNPRGVALVKSILAYTGKPMKIKQNGRWRQTFGWSESRVIDYPAPVGRRRVFLCEVPDLDIFPQRYGANTVAFRAGLQLTLFNFGLYILGRLRRRNIIKDLPKWGGTLARVSNWLRGFGDLTGGMIVQLSGIKDEQEVEHTVSLIVRDENGPAIPCSPAIALMRKWIEHGVDDTGAKPCVGLLSLDALKQELANYDIVMVRN